MDMMKKVPIREQDPKVRAMNFEEVCLGYNQEEAQAEAGRCLNCKNAQCVKGCPVSIDIPKFIHEVKEGKFEEAASSIDKAEESMAQAHNCLFGLVTDEAQGKKAELNIILVHAQDHLAMAAMAEEQAKLAYDLYHRIAGLEEKKGVKK